MRSFYDHGSRTAIHHLKLAFPQQLTRTLVGAGVGGALGAGVGALTGQSADPNDPLSTGTRGRNALIGGGLGAVLGGGAGFMADKGTVRGTSLFTNHKGPAALQLGAARSQSYDNLGGSSSHDPTALQGNASGMGDLSERVRAGNTAAAAPFSHIPDPSGTRFMAEGSFHPPTQLAPRTPPTAQYAPVQSAPRAAPSAQYTPTQPVPPHVTAPVSHIPTAPGPAHAPAMPQYSPVMPPGSPPAKSLADMIAEGSDKMRRANEAAMSSLPYANTVRTNMPVHAAITGR